MPLFADSGFTDELYVALAGRVEERSFPANHVLIKQGDFGSTFYILERGEVKIVKDGNEVARLQKGAHFGEQARAGQMLESHRRSKAPCRARCSKRVWSPALHTCCSRVFCAEPLCPQEGGC